MLVVLLFSGCVEEPLPSVMGVGGDDFSAISVSSSVVQFTVDDAQMRVDDQSLNNSGFSLTYADNSSSVACLMVDDGSGGNYQRIFSYYYLALCW